MEVLTLQGSSWLGAGLDLARCRTLTRMQPMAGPQTMIPTSNAPRPIVARLVCQIALVLTMAAVAACAMMPNTAPTNEDIEKGLTGLSGMVTDAQSGAPVVGTVITAQGRTSTSTVSGTFDLGGGMTGGVFPVKVSHGDYVEVVRDVEIKPFAVENFRLERR
jgi:hypothetical protein